MNTDGPSGKELSESH